MRTYTDRLIEALHEESRDTAEPAEYCIGLQRAIIITYFMSREEPPQDCIEAMADAIESSNDGRYEDMARAAYRVIVGGKQ